MKYIHSAGLVIFVALVQFGCGSNATHQDNAKPTAPAESGIVYPVKWHLSVNRISDTEAELQMKASIDKGWHLYSMNQEIPEGPPMSLAIEFDSSNTYSLDGNIHESTPVKGLDPVLEKEVKFYEHEAVYKQKIRILTKDAFTVTGLLKYQACDDEKCLMPSEEDLTFEIPAGGM